MERAKNWLVLVSAFLVLLENQENLHIHVTWEEFEKDLGPRPTKILKRVTSWDRDEDALVWNMPVERSLERVPKGLPKGEGPRLTYRGRLVAKALVGCAPFMGKEELTPGTREWDQAALYVARLT